MLRTRIIASTVALVVVSAVFATAMTFVNRVESFVAPTRVVPSEPAPVTLRVPALRVVQISDIDGQPFVQSSIVERGATVRDPSFAAVVEAYEESRRPPRADRLLGLWIVYFLLALMLGTYLRSLSPGRGALLRTQLGIAALLTLMFVGEKVFLLATPYPAHIVPVGAMSLWAALYLDRRIALIVGIATAFFAASLVGFRLSVVAVFLASAISAPLALGDKTKAVRVLQAGVVAGACAGGVYVAANVIFEGHFDIAAELADPWRSALLASIGGGMLSGLVAVIFGALAVFTLGSVTRARLVELSDLDQPLLKKVMKEAPGSWEHSRAMANLAEAAANAIGADALLTRVGAYYHDLGKSCQAKYFVENLQPGRGDPAPRDRSRPLGRRDHGARRRRGEHPAPRPDPGAGGRVRLHPSRHERHRVLLAQDDRTGKPARARRDLLPLPGDASAHKGDRDPHARRLDRGRVAHHRSPRARRSSRRWCSASCS